ncbi:MAG: RsmD family RNA methyltransferase [Bacteroidetes bacterium]|nr:RsmD family RNA methyltransferase [Bacteroidota bacterium]
MRIISGIHKGRSIHAPKNLPVRPTTDFAKEALFNILSNHFDLEECSVLDLFCGSGNITYEFASRESKEITSVDINFHCSSFVKKTCSDFKMDQVKVIKSDVFSFLKNAFGKYDIVFADPPYDLEKIELIPDLVFEKNILKENGMLILEHGPKTSFLQHPYFKEHRKYGNVNFSLFYKTSDSLSDT